jgi:hypothetical protein
MMHICKIDEELEEKKTELQFILEKMKLIV